MKKNQNHPGTTADKTGSDQLLNISNNFPAGIVHDLNNTLAVIKLYAQLGLRNPSGNEELKETFSIILDQVSTAKQLIDKIIDSTRHIAAEK